MSRFVGRVYDRMGSPQPWAYYHPAAAVLVSGVLTFLSRMPRTAEEIIIRTPTPLSVATVSLLRVYVSGAVARPDVYYLPPGSITRDAIEAAGGMLPEAVGDHLNLAQEIYDQQHLYVPREGEVVSFPLPEGQEGGLPSGSRQQVNINLASAAELETLPRIGPTLAQKIVAYRTEHGPFADPHDLMLVPGIGEAIFEEIKELIIAGGGR